MANDMIPVARTSFCIQAYQAAHNLSATFSSVLYLPISSNWPQYVPEDKIVEFLYRMLDNYNRQKGHGSPYIVKVVLFPLKEK